MRNAGGGGGSFGGPSQSGGGSDVSDFVALHGVHGDTDFVGATGPGGGAWV